MLTSEFHTRCEDCLIHSRLICQTTPEKTIEELAKISRIRKVKAGQTIIPESDSFDSVGNVVSGVVKLTTTLEDGRQQNVGLLFPSDFFGHPFSEESRFAYEAASDVEVCVFELHAFESMLKRHPEIEHQLLLKVLNQLDATREWLVLLGSQNAKERIASFLVLLLRRTSYVGCGKHGSNENPIIRLPIKRADIALALATTVETISRQLHNLEKQGVLRIIESNTFEILEPDRLCHLAGHDEWLKDWRIPALKSAKVS